MNIDDVNLNAMLIDQLQQVREQALELAVQLREYFAVASIAAKLNISAGLDRVIAELGAQVAAVRLVADIAAETDTWVPQPTDPIPGHRPSEN